MGTAEKEHAHLIALCRAQKVEEACRFLERHIEAVRKDLLQVVAGSAIAPRARQKREQRS
jgi:DNA-binding GntR family transcriptional regulator